DCNSLLNNICILIKIEIMGICITDMFSAYGNGTLGDDSAAGKNSVFHLADQALKHVVDKELNYSHLLAATSCPDAIAPSLGQCINQQYNSQLSGPTIIDIIQGCTGGVSALILASQLSEYNKSNVLVVASDAAQKA